MATKKTAKRKQATPKEVPVLIGTETYNLWFGYATDTTGANVTLKRARQVIYWSADVKGAGGLAVTGPSATCRIGAAVPEVEARRVSTVMLLTPAAVAAFEAAPWGR